MASFLKSEAAQAHTSLTTTARRQEAAVAAVAVDQAGPVALAGLLVLD
jgi:hypothetical protein